MKTSEFKKMMESAGLIFEDYDITFPYSLLQNHDFLRNFSGARGIYSQKGGAKGVKILAAVVSVSTPSVFSILQPELLGSKAISQIVNYSNTKIENRETYVNIKLKLEDAVRFKIHQLTLYPIKDDSSIFDDDYIAVHDMETLREINRQIDEAERQDTSH